MRPSLAAIFKRMDAHFTNAAPPTPPQVQTGHVCRTPYCVECGAYIVRPMTERERNDRGTFTSRRGRA